MKHRQFTEEQIIRILKEQEGGVRTGDICRRRGIAESIFYICAARACCLKLRHSGTILYCFGFL